MNLPIVLNNTFEGKIWVNWKGKDGKMGQEVSWREKPNIFYIALVPRVRGILNVNGTGTRVHSCKMAVCRVPNLWLRPAAHTSMEMAAFSVQHEFAFLMFMSTLDGHRPKKKNRPSDRQAKLIAFNTCTIQWFIWMPNLHRWLQIHALYVFCVISQLYE